MKHLSFDSTIIEIEDPIAVKFESEFDRQLYSLLYNRIQTGSLYEPVLDTDLLHDGTYGLNIQQLFSQSNLKIKKVSSRASHKERLTTQYMVRDFLSRFPHLLGLFVNNVTLASIAIKNAELLYRAPVDSSNFIDIKGVIDRLNRSAWNRERDVSESQSGVSTLGTISETLLKIVFDSLVDNTNFFKVDKSEIQSYGDFVLMCLPNNLWLSVKSNFARERLLASGYTNDILGVGFFEDSSEFTGIVRIRNFQRAGFLAMYCPDAPVSESQIANQSNTYDEIISYFNDNAISIPTNINGKPFIRPLSGLYNDLSVLLNEPDIRKRTTVTF